MDESVNNALANNVDPEISEVFAESDGGFTIGSSSESDPGNDAMDEEHMTPGKDIVITENKVRPVKK